LCDRVALIKTGAGEVMAVVTLTFLGSFQAAIDSVAISGFRSDKVRALLAYLALEASGRTAASACAGCRGPTKKGWSRKHLDQPPPVRPLCLVFTW
jgi:hypothetical protein